MLVDDPALAAALRAGAGRPARRACAGVRRRDRWRQIDALAEPELALPGGARLSFHPTPALMAIDVDAGAGPTGRGTAARVNRALLPALARQIRLRNLSGAILVDLAGLPARQRSALGPALAAALADDPLRPRLAGVHRAGAGGDRAPARPSAAARAAGRTARRRPGGVARDRRAARAEPGRMPALRAAPAVVAALEDDRGGAGGPCAAHRTRLDLAQRPVAGAQRLAMEAP